MNSPSRIDSQGFGFSETVNATSGIDNQGFEFSKTVNSTSGIVSSIAGEGQ